MRDRFRLRPLTEDDLRIVFDWRNSDRIRSNMYSSHFIAWEEHQRWFERLAGNNNKVYRIFEVGESPAGLVNFIDIDRNNGLSSWGFYMGATGYPKNTGLIMGVLGLELAFQELGLRKICGECFAFNIASIKFHERLGFKQEGYFVEHIRRGEKFEDIVRFALFDRDWSAKQSALEDIILDCEG